MTKKQNGTDTWTGILKDADCILVVKDGKIVEKGSHEELMSHDGIYKNCGGTRWIINLQNT